MASLMLDPAMLMVGMFVALKGSEDKTKMLALRQSLYILGMLALILLTSGAAQATVMTYATPVGSIDTDNESISAKVTFTTSANQIIVTLRNLQANPTSAGQNISGLLFTISTGLTSESIASVASVDRTVNSSNGTYSDVAVSGNTHWALSASGGQLDLTTLSGGHPIETIIGPPNASHLYSNANPSITGSSHTPELGETATFTLNVAGVTSATTISNVTFGFGTDGNDMISGVVATPEPATLSLLGLGGLAMLRRRK